MSETAAGSKKEPPCEQGRVCVTTVVENRRKECDARGRETIAKTKFEEDAV